ncbi:hypothetical protein [Nocardioides sambongensis]|uniref:hypothetical protein n=1 Tax=Nocardioides sambongensis TaxID=2589074 RepID=UPI00112C567D|nr:hypothetical protein [Nocardioides sambongensis]
MTEAQRQAWHALMDLYERLDTNWTLIGGQLVHLHCADRGVAPTRPTDDIDTVVNIRASGSVLETFTGALRDMGFTADTSADGVQHRWRRDLAQIDVLIPEGVGERAAAAATGIGGAPTVQAPGTTQALNRTEPVTVVAEGRTGTVLRPNLVGALVGKAAARTEIASDRASTRHCTDFVVLASLISARDFRETEIGPKDRKRLRKMLTYCRKDTAAMSVDGASDALDRLERAAGLNG